MHSKRQSGIFKSPYFSVAVMAVLSFISMYILMYSMVNAFSNIYNNLNQAYMALLMTAPMIIFHITLMWSMFRKKKWNWIIIALSVLLLFASFTFIRQQTAIGDEQFILSMVPHHSGAILMCEQASIQDPELKALCDQIIESQQAEIDQMKQILSRLENRTP
jgi:hypothetical protein